MTTSDTRAWDEIIEFLEELESSSPELPNSVVRHWSRALEICKQPKPSWKQAMDHCNCIMSVLNGLRSGEPDLGQLDRAQGQILTLSGAIQLGQREWRKASYYFDQAARRLRHWDYAAFESLAYFGCALTHKQEKNWPRALEALQKASDALDNLPILRWSTVTKLLQRRIAQEIDSVPLVTVRESTQTYHADDQASEPSGPAIFKATPIPIYSDIAAGRDVIAPENPEDQLLLDDEHRNRADFAARTVGDSMKDDGILPGDIVLIRYQETNIGDIVAAVIKTQIGAEGVLKRFAEHRRQGDLRHTLLKSSNPSSKHLVIIPSGANVRAIKTLYQERIRSGSINNQIKFYEDAEVEIFGKFVGLVRNI